MWPGPRPTFVLSEAVSLRHGPKIEGRLCLLGEELGAHVAECGQAEAYVATKWHRNPSSRLTTIDMGRKVGAEPLFRGSWVPHLTQDRLGRGLRAYQVAS